jgi:hypothetical protein
MKPLVILRTVRSGALPDGKGAMVEVETTEGLLELRFTAEDAERLASAVQAARKELEALRVKTGKPPLGTARTPQRWETAIDPVEQQALLRTHFSDGTTETTPIPRPEIARITRFLDEALKRFEAGAEMRQ